MKSNISTRALSSIMKEISKGKYDFNHPLQRKSGQWNSQMNSLLVDSVIRSYPIPLILMQEYENGKFGIIDGKQRLSILYSYVNNEFPLHRSIKPTNIDGENYELAKKKFDQLDEAVKDKFLAKELQLYILRDVTENDIREIFSRINTSKNLNNAQRRTTVENQEMSEITRELANHEVFDKLLTPTQRKRDTDRDLIRETLMLIEATEEQEHLAFDNNSINAFITDFQEDLSSKEPELSKLKESLDTLNSHIEKIKVNIASLPMLLWSSYVTLNDNKNYDDFINKVNDFIENYDTNEDYKQLCMYGTASNEKVKARYNYWKNMISQ